MISRKKPMGLLRFLAAVGALLLLASCGPKAQRQFSQLNTPKHHTFAGIRLLDQQKFVDAGREFELALRLDPDYSKAHVGIGLVKACQRDFSGGFDALRQAEPFARSDEEKVFLRVGIIRLYTLSHSAGALTGTGYRPDDGWLKYARDAFEQAVLIDPGSAAVHYFMGEAYLTALDPDRAGGMFGRVLELKGEYAAEADSRLRLVQKIRRAMPRSVTGKKIALVERITRAEAAALLIEELKIDALYAGRRSKGFDSTPGEPEKARGGFAVRTDATDVGSHPLRAEIEAVIRIGVRGLDVHPDGTFRPDERVTRADYATMIGDILVKISGDRALATRFAGVPSPFPDLRADRPYFNAVMLLTSRGFMGVNDPASGAFAPLGPVGGGDALLVIRKMREELRY